MKMGQNYCCRRNNLTARNLMDFLLACIRIIAIFVMVVLGFWVYQMYHFAKLDQPKNSNKEQPKQQMEQKVSLPEKSTIISMENSDEKLD